MSVQKSDIEQGMFANFSQSAIHALSAATANSLQPGTCPKSRILQLYDWKPPRQCTFPKVQQEEATCLACLGGCIQSCLLRVCNAPKQSPMLHMFEQNGL